MKTRQIERVVFRNRIMQLPEYPTTDSQRKIVFQAFSRCPKTMLQVSFETGILRGNICRFLGTWIKEDKIIRVGSGICPISKHPAGMYTTNF